MHFHRYVEFWKYLCCLRSWNLPLFTQTFFETTWPISQFIGRIFCFLLGYSHKILCTLRPSVMVTIQKSFIMYSFCVPHRNTINQLKKFSFCLSNCFDLEDSFSSECVRGSSPIVGVANISVRGPFWKKIRQFGPHFWNTKSWKSYFYMKHMLILLKKLLRGPYFDHTCPIVRPSAYLLARNCV